MLILPPPLRVHTGHATAVVVGPTLDNCDAVLGRPPPPPRALRAGAVLGRPAPVVPSWAASAARWSAAPGASAVVAPGRALASVPKPSLNTLPGESGSVARGCAATAAGAAIRGGAAPATPPWRVVRRLLLKFRHPSRCLLMVSCRTSLLQTGHVTHGGSVGEGSIVLGGLGRPRWPPPAPLLRRRWPLAPRRIAGEPAKKTASTPGLELGSSVSLSPFGHTARASSTGNSARV